MALGRSLSGTLLLLALLCTSAHAQVQRVPLSVVVNALPKSDIVAWMDNSGVLWIPVSDLRLWGVTMAAEESFDGVGAVSLKSLSDVVRFDEAQLRLVVDISPTADMGGTRIDLRPQKLTKPALLRSNGLRFDYELGAGKYGETSSLDGNVATRARLSDWQVLDERSFSTIAGQLQQTYSRTTVRRDFPEQALRLDLGALATPSSGLMGWGSWVGVSVGTVHGMDPRGSIESTAKLDALVKYPSTADIYVNGVKQGSFQVSPGKLDLEGIRSANGASNVRVVLRDLYGEESVIEDTRYLSQEVVQVGMHDFTYQIGATPGATSDEEKIGFRGTHRYGLTEDLTFGARLYLTQGVRSVQLDGVYQHDRFGAFGVSALRALTGEAGTQTPATGLSIGHEYRSRLWSWQSGLSRSPSFSTYSTDKVRRAYTRASVDTGRWGQWLTGVYRQSDSVSPARSGLEVGWSKHLGSSVMANLSVVRDTELGAQARAWLVWSLGDNRTASAIVESNRDGSSQEVTYSQSSSNWDDAAWRVGTRQQGGQTGSRMSYEKGTGPVMLRAQVAAMQNSNSARVSAQGAVLLDGTRLGLSRARGDAAVLVETPGLSDVRIYRNGLLAGRTDAEGKLWVSGLVSYDEARLSLDENDVPLDQWYLPMNTLRTRPAPGSLAKIGFDLRRISTYELRVSTCEAQSCVPLPAGRVLVTSDLGTQHSLTVENGTGHLDYAIAGTYSFKTQDGRCEGGATLTEPTDALDVELQCK